MRPLRTGGTKVGAEPEPVSENKQTIKYRMLGKAGVETSAKKLAQSENTAKRSAVPVCLHLSTARS